MSCQEKAPLTIHINKIIRTHTDLPGETNLGYSGIVVPPFLYHSVGAVTRDLFKSLKHVRIHSSWHPPFPLFAQQNLPSPFPCLLSCLLLLLSLADLKARGSRATPTPLHWGCMGNWTQLEIWAGSPSLPCPPRCTPTAQEQAQGGGNCLPLLVFLDAPHHSSWSRAGAVGTEETMGGFPCAQRYK